MKTINLMTMKPDEILVKEAFKRAIPSGLVTLGGIAYRQGGTDATDDTGSDTMRYELMRQSDFVREFDVNSHKINSLRYYPNPISIDESTKENSRKHYQKVKTRVAIAFQERIHAKRLATLTGNNVNLRITNANATKKDQEMLGLFRQGWEDKNIENAIYEALSADGKVGDAAICFYLDKGTVGWRCFSYDKGDILYPHYDPATGKLALFGRRYVMKDENGEEITEYLDVWDNKYYCRYRNDKKGVKGALNSFIGAVGGNVWAVDVEATPHNFERIPVAYDRYGEPFWAQSQSLIDAYEMAISQLCENNMAYALRILYAFGAEMDMKSTVDGTPTLINSESTDAKVGYLEPADASSSFTLQLTTLEKNIMKSSFAVETPEIKSGADMSSLTVKMLFADAYQKAMLDSQHFQPFLDDIVELFKYGYGIEMEKTSDFSVFKVKSEIFPYIFMSEAEQVANVVQLVGIGALSKKSASEMAYELGYGVLSEYERLKQEENDANAAMLQRQQQRQDVNTVNQSRNNG